MSWPSTNAKLLFALCLLLATIPATSEADPNEAPLAMPPASPPEAAAKKPDPAPTKAHSPQPSPAAPTISIKAPRTVELAHLVRIEIEPSGGPIREMEVTITPEPEPDDLVYGFKEIAGPDGRPLRVEDRNRLAFTGPPGVYTIEVLAIGAEKGYARQEARVQIRDPRPVVPTAETTAAHASQSQQPDDLLRQWVAGVNSSNRQAEALEVAKAARETAQEIRANRSEPIRAIEDWKTAAYLRMGKSFAAWNQNPNGKSFFAYAEDLFIDSAGLRDFNPANLLDSLADVLEGN